MSNMAELLAKRPTYAWYTGKFGSTDPSNTITWIEVPKINKELTEKQLFSQLEKEIKEVNVKLN